MMTSSSGSRRVRASDMRAALGVLWLCTALLSAWPAFGQDAQDTGRSAPVLIVDMQRIKSDTSAGRDMLAKQTEIRNRIQAGLAERRERLREEENRLAEEREKLTPEAFREQVRAFEQQVFANREFSERESRRLQLVLSRASALLKERATAVLAGIMRERSAEVLLDSTQIILSVNSLDITDEAIRRLDEILPEIPIDLSKPEIEP